VEGQAKRDKERQRVTKRDNERQRETTRDKERPVGGGGEGHERTDFGYNSGSETQRISGGPALYVYTHAHTHTHIYIYIYMYIFMCVCVCIYI